MLVERGEQYGDGATGGVRLWFNWLVLYEVGGRGLDALGYKWSSEMDERTGRFGGTGRVEGKGIGWNWGKMFGWRHDMVRRVVPMDGWSHHRDMDRSASERQQTMTLI